MFINLENLAIITFLLISLFAAFLAYTFIVITIQNAKHFIRNFAAHNQH